MNKIIDIIKNSNNIVILSGAGISTASGLKDFSGSDGLYKQQYQGYNPEYILSYSCFCNNPELTYSFINKFFESNIKATKNFSHDLSNVLNDKGKLKCVITQNIDKLYNLPQEKLIEIHGRMEYICPRCKEIHKKVESFNYYKESDHFYHSCCNGRTRPNIIFYEETYDKELIKKMNGVLFDADLLLVMGTSLKIPFIQNIVETFPGKVIVVNNQEVNCSGLFLNMDLSEFSKRIIDELSD